MRDLWKGLAMITLDEELRKAISEKALCVMRPSVVERFPTVSDLKREFDIQPGLEEKLETLSDLAEKLQIQPDLNALRGIDKLFRERGLILSTYALAEINRWFFGASIDPENQKLHRDDFLAALARFKLKLKPFLGPQFNGVNNQSPAVLEAIGALVSDPELRDHFLKNTIGLREHGFDLSSEEENALRHGFEAGSPGLLSAIKIHELGWTSTGSCTSRLLIYDELFHFNH